MLAMSGTLLMMGVVEATARPSQSLANPGVSTSTLVIQMYPHLGTDMWGPIQSLFLQGGKTKCCIVLEILE